MLLSICSCSKAVHNPVSHTPLLNVQWINSWWWTEELFEICRVSCQNKFVKLVHLVGFIIKKFVTMHRHMSQCTVTCHNARSHVPMQGHTSQCTVTCHDAQSHVPMQGHTSQCTVTCHDAQSHERKKRCEIYFCAFTGMCKYCVMWFETPQLPPPKFSYNY